MSGRTTVIVISSRPKARGFLLGVGFWTVPAGEKGDVARSNAPKTKRGGLVSQPASQQLRGFED
jgi:hypothetical protein